MDPVKILKNINRVGRVSKVNKVDGTVEVLFPDRDNMVSKPIPLLESSRIPNINEQVLCVFLANGIEEGFCLGPFYSKENPPIEGTST